MRVFSNESSTRSRDWPNSPEALSNRLRRAATFLRKVGVEISFDRDKSKKRSRTVIITTTTSPPENDENQLSEPSEPSEISTDLDGVSDSSDSSDSYFSPFSPGRGTRI